MCLFELEDVDLLVERMEGWDSGVWGKAGRHEGCHHHQHQLPPLLDFLEWEGREGWEGIVGKVRVDVLDEMTAWGVGSRS